MPESNPEITIVYTFFGQFERIDDILKEKHPATRVVIVDDCYPKPLEKLEGIDVYRIIDDILWNIPGARNLGFHVSDGWIVSSDIDHLVTRKNIEDILKMKKEEGKMYLFGRRNVDTNQETKHDSEFLIHKNDFEKVGGFDEDFSGHYGFEDSFFILQCQRNLIVVENEEIKVKEFDCPSKGAPRDYAFNQQMRNEKQDNHRNEGLRLRFKWKIV